MVLGRLENGVEVDGLDAQVLQVIQLLNDAVQVAAEKVAVSDLTVLVGAVSRLIAPVFVDGAAAHHTGGIGNAGAAEPVGENLVAHALTVPVGDLFAAVINGELIVAQVAVTAVRAGEDQRIPHQTHVVASIQYAGKLIPQIRVFGGLGLGVGGVEQHAQVHSLLRRSFLCGVFY